MANGIKKNNGAQGVTWRAVVEAGRDPVTGKRKQLKKTFKTKREASDWRTRTLHELRTGTYVEASTVAVGDYLNQWLNTIAPNVRVSTFDRYNRIVRNNLVPSVGSIPLSKLTALHIQEFHSQCLSKGLSTSTVALYHGVLRKALSQAVRWQMLSRNVCDAVNSPKKSPPEMKTWNVEQVKQFLRATSEHPLATLWRLAVSTGMRRGELVGLRWSDIDLERGELAVRRTVTRGADGIVFGEPKTAKGKRAVSLPEGCVSALRQHRVAQSERRLKMGPLWTSTDLVFVRGNGDVLHPNNVTNGFRRIVGELELPRIRFHDLRHTAATLMMANGEHPKIVQERLGHSDISMTLNLYSHVTPNMQKAAAERIELMFGS